MAQVLDLYQTVNKRVLSSRQTARAMSPEVSRSISEGNGTLTIDMARMTTITPSFFDELIRVIEDSVESHGQNSLAVHFTNTTDTQAAKFQTVCRAHSLSLEKAAPGHWVISRP